MAIGADTASDIRIAGPGVEPKHAQITVSMAGFTITDNGTKHGRASTPRRSRNASSPTKT